MNSSYQQRGFSAVELIFVVIVIALIGFLGYTFYENLPNDDGGKATSDTTSQQPTVSDVETAPAISSPDDLDDALETLDETDVLDTNSADMEQLDSQALDF